jgi:adenylosuccinate lyase
LSFAPVARGYAEAELESMALWHERDMSHSSVERVALPNMFMGLWDLLTRSV